MRMTMTYTEASTYTVSDVSTVMRRITADLVMIAQSTGAITETTARAYAYDIEVLAQGGYLKSVDVTLLSGGSNGTEVSATTYTVNTASGNLTTSRPGGVMWPRVSVPYLRLVLYYTGDYDPVARAKTAPKLKNSWSPTDADTRHLYLVATSGRDYVSNGYGVQRKDFGA
jgi:hypothetical protein